MSGYDVHYEIQGDQVVFKNKVIISTRQLDALFRLKHKTTCIHSFLWMELMRVAQGENSVSVRFNPGNFKRIIKALDVLQETKALDYRTEEITENNRKRIALTIYDIIPDLLSVIPMI